jgi:putative membrane protein
MSLLATLPVVFVAVLHVYILVLEMFLWTTPRGLKAFGMKKEYAIQTKALAANQALYNGFLAVGLAWGLMHPVPEFGRQIQHFFLGCVAVAGIYGAATAKAKILFIQTLPASIAIAAVLFA